MNGLITGLKTAFAGDVLVRRFPPLYRAYRRQLRTFDASDLAGRLALQGRLVDRTLAAAAKMPGYGGLSHGGKLAGFPLLTKDQLRSAPENYMARAGLLSVDAATSGSSGIPLSLKRSFASVVFEQAALDHIVALAGADFARDKVAVLRGGSIKDPSDRDPPYWRTEGGGRVLNFSVAHLNAATAPVFLDALETFAPDILWVYPSALEMLTAFLERDGRRLGVRVILSSSEVLTDDVRRKAETLFGACVADYYGQAERACLAYALEAGAYRFMPAYGAVEFEPAEGGEGSRLRLIATNLRNATQPLLRYDTGDIIVAKEALDEAGLQELALGCRSFTRIDGRESDYLIAPDGSRLIGMNHVPRQIAGLVQMQLRQTEPDRVVVLAVAEGLPNDVLQAAITAKVRARLPNTMRVELRFCDAIAREKSGKMPLVVRGDDIGAPLAGAGNGSTQKIMREL